MQGFFCKKGSEYTKNETRLAKENTRKHKGVRGESRLRSHASLNKEVLLSGPHRPLSHASCAQTISLSATFSVDIPDLLGHYCCFRTCHRFGNCFESVS